jgi:hypothetical protein
LADDNQVKEQGNLNEERVSADEIEETIPRRKMLEKVNYNFWELNEGKEAEDAPAEGRDHLVDEDPLEDGAEPLEPDDAGHGARSDEHQNDGEGSGNHF